MKSTESAQSKKIILFTRFPEAGKSKTRLIPALGKHDAAQLQKKMTEHILAMLNGFNTPPQCTIEVRYTGSSHKEMARWLSASPGMTLIDQGTGDLGVRLSRAFMTAFQQGNKRVIAIGADCPSLTAAILKKGFKSLQQNDVVLGPAFDGGYYLIGMRGYWPGVFSQVTWGSKHVLEQTCILARQLDLTYSLLEPLADIDRPDDLRFCRNLTA